MRRHGRRGSGRRQRRRQRGSRKNRNSPHPNRSNLKRPRPGVSVSDPFDPDSATFYEPSSKRRKTAGGRRSRGRQSVCESVIHLRHFLGSRISGLHSASRSDSRRLGFYLEQILLKLQSDPHHKGLFSSLRFQIREVSSGVDIRVQTQIQSGIGSGSARSRRSFSDSTGCCQRLVRLLEMFWFCRVGSNSGSSSTTFQFDVAPISRFDLVFLRDRTDCLWICRCCNTPRRRSMVLCPISNANANASGEREVTRGVYFRNDGALAGRIAGRDERRHFLVLDVNRRENMIRIVRLRGVGVRDESLSEGGIEQISTSSTSPSSVIDEEDERMDVDDDSVVDQEMSGLDQIEEGGSVVSDSEVFVRCHFCEILDAGDVVLGYDLREIRRNLEDDSQISKIIDRLPHSVIVVKKRFQHMRELRYWRLDRLGDGVLQQWRRDNAEKRFRDFEAFRDELEEDADLRRNVILRRNERFFALFPDFDPEETSRERKAAEKRRKAELVRELESPDPDPDPERNPKQKEAEAEWGWAKKKKKAPRPKFVKQKGLNVIRLCELMGGLSLGEAPETGGEEEDVGALAMIGGGEDLT